MVLKRYAGFLTKPASGSIAFDCRFSRKQQGTAQQVQLTRTGFNRWQAGRYDFICTWNGIVGTAVLSPSLYSFDAMLRVIVATMLLSRGGVLIHASGVVHTRAAYVFAGPSGSGKTTIARLAQTPLLNDEIVALSVDKKGGVTATGTPFWGEMGTGPAYTRTVPLNALYFLEKSRSQRSEPLEASAAAGKLLRCICVFGDSPEESTLALEICAKILSATRYAILHFPRQPLNWLLLEESL